MSIYLDDLTDAELLEMQVSLAETLPKVPLQMMRPYAALVNEITKRTQDRGLFVEATGRLTDKGRKLIQEG